MRLRIPAGAPSAATQAVERILACAPHFEGRLIRIIFLPDLRTRRGKLLSGSTVGQEVHAGSDLLRRLIILDQALTTSEQELRRILLHEIFHFVWRRLSAAMRRSYETLIAKEIEKRARGELGWSSEMRKTKLTPTDRLGRSRRWREYLCESFCDSASWAYSEMEEHQEFTLAQRFRVARLRWLREFESRRNRIPV